MHDPREAVSELARVEAMPVGGSSTAADSLRQAIGPGMAADTAFETTRRGAN